MEGEKNYLGKEKVSKLVKKFAVPCVISMLVAALYNIVDQIFIGWSAAGADGNAATNIVYPFTVVALGLALLVGDGAATFFSLKLGAKDRPAAEKSIGNGFMMLIIISILLFAAGLFFQEQILALFGADPAEATCYQFATQYFHIICLGLPFYMIGQGLNAALRVDGSPKYAMFATIAGAVTNIILDPIFIFVFDLGVAGAAIATVIGQVVTFALTLIYVFHPEKSSADIKGYPGAKNFRLSASSLKLDAKILKKILPLGLASLITQLAIVIIMSVSNNLIAKYGHQTIASTGVEFGVVTPLAVVGICMKVFGIVISTVIGVALGGQPIISYNMGAGNRARVKETCALVLKINLFIGLIAFLLFQLAPDFIIQIFGKSASPEYLEFARYCIRIFLGGIILTCFIKTTSILLQAMGKSFQSTALALFRDVIFFVPAIITIATISGSVVTMLWSAVVADILASIVGAGFLYRSLKD